MEERLPAEDADAVSRVTLDVVQGDDEVRALIEEADRVLSVLGFTEHGVKHATVVATRAQELLKALGYKARRVELAGIAGYLHDVGNVVARPNHEYLSALLAREILVRLAMPYAEIAQVMAAIGNHDEHTGEPVSALAAALTLADKSDVRRDRVRNPSMVSFDIHDRVNYAATQSHIGVDAAAKTINLVLDIDTAISRVMEYFEIFVSRMAMCRRAARHLGCDFGLFINDVRML